VAVGSGHGRHPRVIIQPMSGHSHWSTIKRAKGTADAKKSKIFSKVSRLITVAAKQGGGDPDSNPALRLAIDKAKDANMPKATVQKAINKGLGSAGDAAEFEEAIYEGFGPGGVAILVKVITDNKNRAVADIRNLFNRGGGSLGANGSVSYIFEKDPQNPIFTVSIDNATIPKLCNLLEALREYDDVQEVYSNRR
jgi:YebC/PmpR family DNA-binding regulatory protein